MRRLRHGYTNHTTGDGKVVVKRYDGPDGEARLACEQGMLTHLQGALPVPPVLAAEAGALTLGHLPGVPAQELLEAGHGAEVLAACGRVLRRLQAVQAVQAVHDVRALDASGAGPVLVHGDFGPNNLLLDPATFEVTALLDWEFAHDGDPVEDLAWCEWIVRMHHPEHVGALGELFRAYGGPVPPWPERRAAMLAKCAWLEEFCRRRDPAGPGVRQWQERTQVTADWPEWPEQPVTDPRVTVDRQLAAYNGHDLAAFLATYAPEVVVNRRDGSRLEGRDALRAAYAPLFAEGRCQARITGRLTQGDWVVDHETAEGVAAEPLRVLVAYRVRDGLIDRVDFLGG
ncbi:phosphotransferase [Kitasatospora sp. NPDC097643]|uniref:phosphotransferase n=1 Tax=Kitasatospora sp. NPDC097643 TaxID=3157230 RepID=UPI0033289255